jgi:hypothetical protein
MSRFGASAVPHWPVRPVRDRPNDCYGAQIALAGDKEGQASHLFLIGCVLIEQGQLARAAAAFLDGTSINREINDVAAARRPTPGTPARATSSSPGRRPALRRSRLAGRRPHRRHGGGGRVMNWEPWRPWLRPSTRDVLCCTHSPGCWQAP